MSNEFDDRRLATLALEIEQAIPTEGGYLRNAQIRGDELPIQGDRTGLMLLAVAILLRAIDHPAADKVESRIGRITARHELMYGWLIGPDEIRKHQRTQRGGTLGLVILIIVLLLILVLAIIGVVAVVRWII